MSERTRFARMIGWWLIIAVDTVFLGEFLLMQLHWMHFTALLVVSAVYFINDRLCYLDSITTPKEHETEILEFAQHAVRKRAQEKSIAPINHEDLVRWRTFKELTK